MTFDIKTLKRLGYNMIRKHVKVEPELYYTAADELGILIMQDMPCLRPWQGPPDEAQQVEFERQLEVLVTQLKSYTSIFAWVSIPNIQTSIISLGSKVAVSARLYRLSAVNEQTPASTDALSD
jgi:beta-galactosidase/beta-glucuronidase